MNFIIIREPSGSQEKVYLSKNHFLIGRAPHCDIIRDDPLLSKAHCMIFKEGGNYFIKDLDSKNGTYVNGRKINQIQLANRDIINVGNLKIIFFDSSVEKQRKDQITVVREKTNLITETPLGKKLIKGLKIWEWDRARKIHFFVGITVFVFYTSALVIFFEEIVKSRLELKIINPIKPTEKELRHLSYIATKKNYSFKKFLGDMGLTPQQLEVITDIGVKKVTHLIGIEKLGSKNTDKIREIVINTLTDKNYDSQKEQNLSFDEAFLIFQYGLKEIMENRKYQDILTSEQRKKVEKNYSLLKAK